MRTYEVQIRENWGNSTYRKLILVDASSMYAAAKAVYKAQRRGRFRDLHRPEIVQIRDLLMDKL